MITSKQVQIFYGRLLWTQLKAIAAWTMARPGRNRAGGRLAQTLPVGPKAPKHGLYARVVKVLDY
jgi:hypothetical protein